MSESLITLFEGYGDLPAIVIGERSHSYSALAEATATIGDALNVLAGDEALNIALVGGVEYLTYAAICAVHDQGHAAVTTSLNDPPIHIASVLNRARVRVILYTERGRRLAEAAAELMTNPGMLIGLESLVANPTPIRSAPRLRGRLGDLAEHDKAAYIMFTSGTTGNPKGIPVSYSNLYSYLQAMVGLLPLDQHDRASQFFDTTFDLSVHDIFLTLTQGACLFPLDAMDKLTAGQFIRRHSLTVWFSVPSVISVLKRTRQLKEGCLPSLRLSLFCGEAFETGSALSWIDAAPNSRLVNLYGPTEATIAVTYFELHAEDRPIVGSSGVLPIGATLGENSFEIESDQAGGSSAGELLLSGPQVVRGYLDQADTDRYFDYAGKDTRYRTGDLVELDSLGLLHFRGRTDDQIKMNGYRIEPAHVESAVRNILGDYRVVVLSRRSSTGLDSLVAVVEAALSDAVRMSALERLSRDLPRHLVPKSILCMPALPLNRNGKIDRRMIRDLVKGDHD